ncbi:hypothetical protein MLD38_006500 [Melastoma candidum]|uniref:Uncharacterized protein n=1 Tax=Melastoma candidum TaxID=119954 RepID=A0ACB9RN35_9MYRT|nr:hypothetical protein MLD38_006500 [Melastoma candidum]
MQEGRPIAYFSKKLNGAKLNYSTYDKEFLAIVRVLKTWSHYLLSKKFVLHTDHEALKYINGQHKLDRRHAKWVEFLQSFTFVLKHKPGVKNVIADALLRMMFLLSAMETKLIGFEYLKDLYKDDEDFGGIFAQCTTQAIDRFHQLAHAEFAYNIARSSTTKSSPFEVVYGLNPLVPVDRTPLPSVKTFSRDAKKRYKEIKLFHEKIRAQIEKANLRYQERANRGRRAKIFQPGDLVWIHLRKDRFPTKRKNKLMPRAEGPFKIIERINDNAYKVDLPREYGVSATFNVKDLITYEDDEPTSLRINSFQQGEDDTRRVVVSPTPQPPSPTGGINLLIIE